MPSGEIKVIDFGESKDVFQGDREDGGSADTATIRGTPQYLSPILWKAHVVDGNSRFAKHNVYKSDVFSVGLLFFQLSVMEDVTGFNQKSHEFDGEKLISAGIHRLKQRFPENLGYCDLLRMMLKFWENERPSFVELTKHLKSAKNGFAAAFGSQAAEYKAQQLAKKPAGSNELHVQSRQIVDTQPQAPQMPPMQEPIKKERKELKKAASDNCIGVPPDMTESLTKQSPQQN